MCGLENGRRDGVTFAAVTCASRTDWAVVASRRPGADVARFLEDILDDDDVGANTRAIDQRRTLLVTTTDAPRVDMNRHDVNTNAAAVRIPLRDVLDAVRSVVASLAGRDVSADEPLMDAGAGLAHRRRRARGGVQNVQRDAPRDGAVRLPDRGGARDARVGRIGAAAGAGGARASGRPRKRERGRRRRRRRGRRVLVRRRRGSPTTPSAFARYRRIGGTSRPRASAASSPPRSVRFSRRPRRSTTTRARSV